MLRVSESLCYLQKLRDFPSASTERTNLMILTYAGRIPRIAASAFVAQSADVIGDVEIG